MDPCNAVVIAIPNLLNMMYETTIPLADQSRFLGVAAL